MITVITPFARKENLPFLIKALEGKCNWVVLQAKDEPEIEFPSWVTVKRYAVTNKEYISNRLFNEFIADGLDKETQYMILCDDDSVEDGFFDKIPDADVVYVSMKRNEAERHGVWDDWQAKTYHLVPGPDILWAQPDYLQIARVGGEQFIIKGKILCNFRYGLSPIGDGEMILKIAQDSSVTITYVPEAFVLFNYLEDGRFKSFHRKPQALFIGDYYCAGHPNMGVSEWETNIWKSLESTGLAEVAQFHYDKYYFHFAKRGDEFLLQWVKDTKPDFIVLVMYKQFSDDPTAISLEMIQQLAAFASIVSIWGDLEADEQVTLARQVEPYCVKMFGTASEEVVSSLGEKYVYMHVPKDPRVYNNPNKERDIDVLFNGSFGYGREERREVLQYLLDAGIKLVAGGSEGGDHFTTEEYADRYKRAKMTVSFSRARGKDVVNARPFEAMLCGALVLNQESKEMEKLYTRNVDFVSWSDKEYLLSIIQTLLADDEERRIIASEGQAKTEGLYSAKTFWGKVLSCI